MSKQQDRAIARQNETSSTPSDPTLASPTTAFVDPDDFTPPVADNPLSKLTVPETVLGSNEDRPDPTADPIERQQDEARVADARMSVTAADLAAFGQQIGDSIVKGMAANAPRRKVNFGEYNPKTWAQPDKRKTLKLNRDCFQNGGWMNPNSMTNNEIRLLNSITHSGRYIDRAVEVILAQNGSDDEVHLRYKNKTIAQRLELAGKFRNLEDMLTKITEAQAIEREQDEVDDRRRGSSRRR